MKINLNDQECQNVRVALRNLMKQPDINEEAMKVLLVLSDKFIVQKEVKDEAKAKKA